MKTHALPKPIKSKNPVVILRHVIKAIKEEPKRYDQLEVVDKAEDYAGDPEYQRRKFPSCGTVACVGGWVNILTNAQGNKLYSLERAGKVLGLSQAERSQLFEGFPPGVRPRHSVTPRQHASDGIKHIKRFVLKKWGKKI